MFHLAKIQENYHQVWVVMKQIQYLHQAHIRTDLKNIHREEMKVGTIFLKNHIKMVCPEINLTPLHHNGQEEQILAHYNPHKKSLPFVQFMNMR